MRNITDLLQNIKQASAENLVHALDDAAQELEKAIKEKNIENANSILSALENRKATKNDLVFSQASIEILNAAKSSADEIEKNDQDLYQKSKAEKDIDALVQDAENKQNRITNLYNQILDAIAKRREIAHIYDDYITAGEFFESKSVYSNVIKRYESDIERYDKEIQNLIDKIGLNYISPEAIVVDNRHTTRAQRVHAQEIKDMQLADKERNTAIEQINAELQVKQQNIINLTWGEISPRIEINTTKTDINSLIDLAKTTKYTRTLEKILDYRIKSDTLYEAIAKNPAADTNILEYIARETKSEQVLKFIAGDSRCNNVIHQTILSNEAKTPDVVSIIKENTKNKHILQQVFDWSLKYKHNNPRFELNFSNCDLTRLDLSGLKDNINIKNSTLTTKQFSDISKFTSNFEGTVITKGKLNYESDKKYNLNKADLREVTFLNIDFYKKCDCVDTKFNSATLLKLIKSHMIADKRTPFEKKLNSPKRIKTGVYIADLSNLDVTRLDISKAKLDSETKVTGAILTSEQVNQLYENGVRTFDSVTIVNNTPAGNNQNTIISIKNEVFANAKFNNVTIPGMQIELALQNGVNKFEGFIIKGKITLKGVDNKEDQMTTRLSPIQLVNSDISQAQVNFDQFTDLTLLTAKNVKINESQSKTLSGKHALSDNPRLSSLTGFSITSPRPSFFNRIFSKKTSDIKSEEETSLKPRSK